MNTTETAELLARECAKRLSPSVSTSYSIRVISESIPLVELLNVAEAAEATLSSTIRADLDITRTQSLVELSKALTALRDKLPKGAL